MATLSQIFLSWVFLIFLNFMYWRAPGFDQNILSVYTPSLSDFYINSWLKNIYMLKVPTFVFPAPLPLKACTHAKLLQSCLTLCSPVDCSLPGSSVHGILQARMLEWVAMPSSRGSSWPGDWTCISCVAGGFFITELPGKPMVLYIKKQNIFNLLVIISQRWQRLTTLNI